MYFKLDTTKEKDVYREEVRVSDFGSVRNIRTKSGVAMVCEAK